MRLLTLPVASGQLQLNRLTAHPQDYMNAMDSIVSWCVGKEPTNDKVVHLHSATAYNDTAIVPTPIKKIIYNHRDDVTQVTGDENFDLHTMQANCKLTGKKKDVAGNTLGGVITLLTGIKSQKTKYYQYTEDNAFTDRDKIFHCVVNYLETDVAERFRTKAYDGSRTMSVGNYKFAGLSIEPTSQNLVIVNGDTICTFYMAGYSRSKQFKKIWNGYDSSTIAELPSPWNDARVKEWQLSGSIGTDQFRMESVNDGNLKKFFANDQLVAIISGNRFLAYGELYKDLKHGELKLITILALISSKYHNYN